MAQPEITFTGEQAAGAQTALREALGLAAEQFSVQSFVGMVSDEIEQLRAKGHTDEQISQLIANAIGVKLRPEDIERFYASPEARGHQG